ncbi:hypothetical protein HHI36_010887 [Cryptolaemus montrouzieri]|uniref:Transmembrane protein 53 n=1 Tax=Cryptolaemus montrouzieri TaxID=559131 RepID=A0ABD2MKR3_9CUCU
MAVSRVISDSLWFLTVRGSTDRIQKTFMAVTVRRFSQLEVTKNIQLVSKDANKISNFKLIKQSDRPCVILLSWLMARRKHIQKFIDYYTKHEFDVLCINITPWQLLWPTKGTQIVASDILRFMDKNYLNSPCLLHGFSVGAYLWAEVMVQMAAEQERYKPVISKIVGQIWDSAADVTELSVGIPFAVFPNNKVMQKTLAQYIHYHLKTFDKVATRHYVRASQMFHTSLITSPALLFLSKTDPIGSFKSNSTVKETWENMGIKVYWKCWDKSPHVGHFHKHREEYIESLNKFLEDISLISQSSERVRAKL